MERNDWPSTPDHSRLRLTSARRKTETELRFTGVLFIDAEYGRAGKVE